jgi:surfactin synthase thioesterase subunit
MRLLGERCGGILRRADLRLHTESAKLVRTSADLSPIGKILRENPELRAATLPAVRSALAAHDGPDGVRLNAATWVVTARHCRA